MGKLNCPIRHQAINTPEAIAIRLENSTLTYDALDELIEQIKCQFNEQGVKEGAVVALRDDNSLLLVAAFFATLRLKATCCPVSYLYTETELDEYLNEVGFDFLWQSSTLNIYTFDGCSYTNNVTPLMLYIKPAFTGELSVSQHQSLLPDEAKFHEANTFETGTYEANAYKTKNEIQLNANSPATLIFTSGSSGNPKAVAHSLNNHYYSALGAKYEVELINSDCWLVSLPIHHIGGLAIVFRCFFSGASIALVERKNLYRALSTQPITHASLVPTQMQKLIEQLKDGNSVLRINQNAPQNSQSLQERIKLTHIMLGGAPISETLLVNASTLNIHIFYSYGLTEMCSQVATERCKINTPTNASTTSSIPINSFKNTLPYREWKFVNGEIAVKGKTLFLGYIRHKKLVKPFDQGWYFTNDLIDSQRTFDLQNLSHSMNEQDVKEHIKTIEKSDPETNVYIKIRGRKDNMFICGGENYQPEYIESVISSHSKVEKVLIVPRKDKKLGHSPVAYIKWKNDLLAKDHESHVNELQRVLIKKVAKIKIPKDFILWPNDMNASLKVKRAKFISLANL